MDGSEGMQQNALDLLWPREEACMYKCLVAASYPLEGPCHEVPAPSGQCWRIRFVSDPHATAHQALNRQHPNPRSLHHKQAEFRSLHAAFAELASGLDSNQ